MNKEDLLKHIADTETGMKQLEVSHIKLQGHLEVFKFQLSELEKMGESCGESTVEPVVEIAHEEHA